MQNARTVMEVLLALVIKGILEMALKGAMVLNYVHV